jgi:hypothetical protein
MIKKIEDHETVNSEHFKAFVPFRIQSRTIIAVCPLSDTIESHSSILLIAVTGNS